MSAAIESDLEELERMGFGHDEPDLERSEPDGRASRGRERRRGRRRRAQPAVDDWDRGCAEWYRQMKVLRAEYD